MAKNTGKEKGISWPVVRNKKAWHEYELYEKVEAGISLVGTEVKSLRIGQGDLDGSYARITDNQCWLIGCKIAPYPQCSGNNHEPERKRKLLLHKSQIKKIKTKLTQRGFTLIPLNMYFNDRGLLKVELALASGKRQYDKRAKIQLKQHKKDIARSVKKYRR